MKKGRINYILSLALIPLSLMYSCKKSELNQVPIARLSPSTLNNAAGVNYLLIGAYSMLDGVGSNSGQNSSTSNWMFGSVTGGDAYKGSQPSDGGQDALPVEDFTYNTSNPYISAKWNVSFDGVDRANDVLRTIPAAADLSAAAATEITAEARFLRGFYYLELRKTFGQVPYTDEKTTMFNVVNTADIYPKIEADFQFAVANMAATQTQRGRANSWAAMAFLAKTYMFEHKFALALPLLQKMIASGVTAGGQPYALTSVFQQNFSPEASQKNSAESIFAYQSSVNDGGAGNNGDRDDDLNFPYGSGGPGGCCGWDNPSQSLANSFKTDANGLPLLTSFDVAGQDVSNGATPYAGTIDPRIDITMARPKVPFLDWGLPQAGWIRDATDGVFNPRKNVYSKSEKGTNTDNTAGVWNNTLLTSNNINLMRFADVVLMAAEAEIEVGSAANALTDVNMIRARAANPAGWVYLNSTYSPGTSTYPVNATPADNYKVSLYPAGAFTDLNYARKAVHFERKLELAMEGMRFFDLQRWDGASTGLPNGTLTSTGSMSTEINAYIAYDKNINSQLNPAVFVPGINEYFAIPQDQLDLSKSLNGGKALMQQNKGY